MDDAYEFTALLKKGRRKSWLFHKRCVSLEGGGGGGQWQSGRGHIALFLTGGQEQ